MRVVNVLSASVGLALVCSGANAGGIGRSSQSVDVFFQDGNYIEAGYVYVDPKIDGVDQLGNKIDDIAKAYDYKTLGVKLAPTKDSSIALLYDQPFGVSNSYPEGNIFHNDLGSVMADVDSQSLTLMGGGELAKGIKVYAGIAFQEASGEVGAAVPLGPKAATRSVLANPKVNLTAAQFAGLQKQAKAGNATAAAQVQAITQQITKAASTPTAYKVYIRNSNSVGYLLGAAYEIPKIALRLAATYRSETKHNANTLEAFEVGAKGNYTVPPTAGKMDLTLPQSVNLNFQTGLNQKTLLLASLRWVNWKAFNVNPIVFAQLNNGRSLASYDKDEFSGSIGIGRKLTDTLSAQISYGHSFGTGERYTLLGPYGGKRAVALGLKYSPTKNHNFSAGAQYSKLGDAENVSGNNNFKDNYAIAFGAKYGYRF